MEEMTTLELRCLFCKSTEFILPDEDYILESGDQVVCANCGNSNDYDSLMRVANEKAEKWIEEQAKKEFEKISKQFERMFK